MSLIHNYTVSGICCDRVPCTAQILGDEMNSIPGGRHYRQLAVSQGWTLWTGRSLRAYCPDHKPSPKHNMQQVTS